MSNRKLIRLFSSLSFGILLSANNKNVTENHKCTNALNIYLIECHCNRNDVEKKVDFYIFLESYTPPIISVGNVIIGMDNELNVTVHLCYAQPN